MRTTNVFTSLLFTVYMTAHVRGTCFPTAHVFPYICVYNKERTLHIDRTHIDRTRCTNTVHNNTSHTGGCYSLLPRIYSHALRSAQGGSLAVICAQIRKVTGTNKTSEKNKQPPCVAYVAIHSDDNVTNGLY